MGEEEIDNKQAKLQILKQRQALPLDIKVMMTKRRIREFYDYFNGNVYLAFSGGKDSTVLLHIIRNEMQERYRDIMAVFIDTGLEFPEVKRQVYSFVNNKTEYKELDNANGRVYTEDNITIIRPKMMFKDVIDKYGYPVVSKEQSQYIKDYRNTGSEYMRDIRLNGNKNGNFKISNKWQYLIDAPFEISDKCCYVMKKEPSRLYENETGNHPILGVMAGDGILRQTQYIKEGSCNSFDSKRPKSKPLSFWLEEDVLRYVKEKNIKIADVYGEIKCEGGSCSTTGRSRTGCIFCAFGVHLEDEPNRFQKLKKTHPKLWKYCIEDLEMGKVLDYIGVSYEPDKETLSKAGGDKKVRNKLI